MSGIELRSAERRNTWVRAGAELALAGALVAGAAALGCRPAGAGETASDAAGAAAAHEAATPDSGAVTFGRQPIATGVTLNYAVRGPESGPAVILLHGYSDSWFSYSPILSELPAGYRVYSLDQRGHGDSDRPAAQYHMADLAADVLAFMDARRIGRAVIVGHSMGSFVAQYVARAAPGRVAGVVLLGSATSVRALAGLDEFAALVAGFGDTLPAGFIREFQVSTIHHPVSDEFLERVIDESEKLPAYVWREIMVGMLASPPIPGFETGAPPALILRGERDLVFPDPAEQDSLVARFPGAELVVLQETGHAVHWERPAETLAALVPFLERVAPVD